MSIHVTKASSGRLRARCLTLAACTAAAVVLGASAARADLKITSTITTTGMPAQASMAGGMQNGKPLTSLAYYKGEKRRTEFGTTVIIYDCVADSMYTLDTAKKTYYKTSLKEDAGAAAAMENNPLMQMINFTFVPKFDPPGTTKTIMDKSATDYHYSMLISIQPKDPSMAMIPDMTMTMSVDDWRTEGITLPANCEKMNAAATLNGLPKLPFAPKGMKEFTQKVAAIKGVSLLSTMTMSMKASAKGGAGDAGLPKEPFVTKSEVTAISEAPLDDSLFVIPADYKKIDAPTPGGGIAPDTSGAL